MLLQPAPCAPSAGFPRPPAALGAVGGLPYHTTDASLRKYFEGFGDIEEAVVITDRQTGKSRGYGFVTMADRAAAERACKDPNPNIDGRKANVNLAYLGAKPRSLQTGFAIGVQQLHPTLIQRTYGWRQLVTADRSNVCEAATVVSLSVAIIWDKSLDLASEHHRNESGRPIAPPSSYLELTGSSGLRSPDNPTPA
eukprot:bmy_00235T0